MDSRRSSSPNGRRNQGGVASLEENSQRHESSVPFSQSSRDCPICADPLPQVQAGLAACGAFPAEHVFCVVCITTAVLSDSRCPLCREEFNQVGLVMGDTGGTVFPDRSRTNHLESVPPGPEFNFTQELNAISQPMDLGRLDNHVETPPPPVREAEVEVIMESQIVVGGPPPYVRPTFPKGRPAPMFHGGATGFPHLSPKSGGGVRALTPKSLQFDRSLNRGASSSIAPLDPGSLFGRRDLPKSYPHFQLPYGRPKAEPSRRPPPRSFAPFTPPMLLAPAPGGFLEAPPLAAGALQPMAGAHRPPRPRSAAPKAKAGTSREPGSFRRVEAAPSGSAQLMERNRDRWLKVWVEVVTEDLGTSCQLFQNFATSPLKEEHFKQTVKDSSPASLARHLGYWRPWRDWMQAHGLDPARPTVQQAADFFLEVKIGAVSDRGVARTTRAKAIAKTLLFISEKAGCPLLTSVMNDPTVRGYVYDSTVRVVRKEALALPLAIIIGFEERIANATTPLAEKIWLGNLLLAFWASLRWSEVQRTRPDSLCIDGTAIRGVSWLTKTSRSGMPFGANAFGLKSYPPHWGWAHHYVASLVAWMSPMSALSKDSVDFDFLMPDILPLGGGGHQVLAAPMSYIAALTRFRWTLTCSWLGDARLTPAQARLYGLHSLKKSLLSYARQANFSKEDRQEQGHHRDGSNAARLYSADDVFGPLRLQASFIKMVTEQEFRPLRAQLRGGSAPIAEPMVSFAPRGVINWTAPVVPALVIPWAPASAGSTLMVEARPPVPSASFADDASDTSEEPALDSSSDEEASGSGAASEGQRELYLVNFLTGAYHAAEVVPTGTILTSPLQGIELDGMRVKTCCGRRLTMGAALYSLEDEPPINLNACNHKSCQRMFAAISQAAA